MKTIFYLLISLLTACSSMNNEFNCKTKNQGVCASLSQVNKLIDEGYFGEVTKEDNETQVWINENMG